MRAPLATLVAGVLLAIALVAAYRLLATDERAGAAIAPAASEETSALLIQRLDRLQAELVRLRETVERLETAPAVPLAGREPALTEEAPTDTNPAAEGDALPAALARLENTLRLEFEKTRELIRSESGAAAIVERLRSDRRHVDWAAWEDVIAVWGRDRDEARDLVKLLTAEELIERYGPPTDVWTNTNGLTWQYARADPLDPTTLQEVILRLPDGYVAQFHYRETKAKE